MANLHSPFPISAAGNKTVQQAEVERLSGRGPIKLIRQANTWLILDRLKRIINRKTQSVANIES